MKKYCPECKEVTKTKCELTVSKEDGVFRKNTCAKCYNRFFTVENETTKLDFDLSRRKCV